MVDILFVIYLNIISNWGDLMLLELDELFEINSKSVQGKDEISRIKNLLNNELYDINSNVASDGLIVANNEFKEEFSSVLGKISSNLEVLNSFYKKQIETYKINMEDAVSRIESLIITINNGVNKINNIKIVSSSISDANNAQYDGNTKTVELPKNVNSSTTTYMNWNQKWNRDSRQRKVYDKAFANNDVTLDDDGFYYINDGKTNRYVVACTEKYGVSGDYIDVYQEDGSILKCVIGDTKSYGDTNSGEYGHMYSGTINVLEYMTNWSGSHSNPGIVRKNLQQNVVKVVNTGKTYI